MLISRAVLLCVLCRTAGICQAASRLFIFDYGGTLLHKEKYDIYIKRQTLSAIEGRKPSGTWFGSCVCACASLTLSSVLS
jgi:hypothetical protein